MRSSCLTVVVLLAGSGAALAQSPLEVTNAATFIDRNGVAPGGLASLFATLSGFNTGTALSAHWDSKLNGVQVWINGKAAPLYYVQPGGNGSGQINFQVPFEAASGAAGVTVTVNGTAVAQGTMKIAPVSPGIFTIDFAARQGAILNQDYSLNSASSRAQRGDVIQVFGTGQGPLQTSLEDGRAPQSYSMSSQTPAAYVAGVPAAVQFSGVVGYPGLWQINVVVPDRPFITGPTPLVLVQNGVQSNPVTFWVVD